MPDHEGIFRGSFKWLLPFGIERGGALCKQDLVVGAPVFGHVLPSSFDRLVLNLCEEVRFCFEGTLVRLLWAS